MTDGADAASAAVWVEEVGRRDGPLVVLVHGTMDRGTGMARVARRLRDRARVIIYDRRGYGRSRALGGPYTMAPHADDLIELLAGRPAVLVGHSMGGNVALAAASRHPELVLAVLVYETPLSWAPWWPLATAGAVALAAGEEPGHGDPAGDAAEAFLRRMLGRERWEQLPERVRLARRAEGPVLVGELRDARHEMPFSVERIVAPVAVARGEHAHPHHVQACAALAEMFTTEVVVLPGAGHAAPVTHPDELAALVSREVLEG